MEPEVNLLTVFRKYPDQESCIEHLEKVRFANDAYCPLCGGMNVARKTDGERVGRWNCHDCKSSFNVLSGTIFEKTRIPLQKWFLGISLMVNTKKTLSSYQLARDLEMTQPTALYMQQRIRAAMTREQALIQGIVEADETNVGGKPRKAIDHNNDKKHKRGRGTEKTPVIDAVERGGEVVARVSVDLTGNDVLKFIKNVVKPKGSILITDKFRAYNPLCKMMPHFVAYHQFRYVEGLTHTNTHEGFWTLLKRAWYGNHHHYMAKYMPLFVVGVTWKYNNRKNGNALGTFIKGVFA